MKNAPMDEGLDTRRNHCLAKNEGKVQNVNNQSHDIDKQKMIENRKCLPTKIMKYVSDST